MAVAAPGPDELLRLDSFDLFQPGSHRFSPLVSWLIATTHPSVTVELGPGDRGSLVSTCEAVLQTGAGARCAAVLLPAVSGGTAHEFRNLVDELSGRFGGALHGFENEAAGLADVSDGKAGLVHVALFETKESSSPDIDGWLDVLGPGAVMVVTTTASDASTTYADAKRRITESLPAVSISLGLTSEAVVAQRPHEDSTPVVDMLRKAPFAVGAFLTMFGEQVELQHLLHDEPEPSQAVRALIGQVIDQQHAEREAFLSALRVYKDETTRLTAEVVEARRELSTQVEAARREREHLVGEFLDRVDHLSSKISTSAARYEAQLAEKDVLLNDGERRVEAYAGIAANAQSTIDGIHRSTSWRVTAPVRLLSRMLAKRAPAARPEN
jgi:vacuolar-type H+-ATPase subunit H